MSKKLVAVLSTFLFALLLIPTLYVKAASRTVNDQDELISAINDTSVDSIILGQDIDTTQKINITRPLTIDGANHTIKYVGKFGAEQSTDNKVWGSIYILHVYKTTATIKNIKLTGGNAALLVNGSTVNLEGVIDVSGNGFGGIELAQGNNVTEKVTLNLAKDADIVNTTENGSAPTLWVPEDSDPATVIEDGLSKEVKPGQELTLNEVELLFNPLPPKTDDNIVVYLMGEVLGILSIAASTLMRKTNKEF